MLIGILVDFRYFNAIDIQLYNTYYVYLPSHLIILLYLIIASPILFLVNSRIRFRETKGSVIFIVHLCGLIYLLI
ncbi:MAG: hypothetical protein AAGG59_04290 [Bacteroidota bacterium]